MTDIQHYARQVDDLLPVLAVKLIRFVKDIPKCDITVAQAFLLHHLKLHGRCTASEIGDIMGITSGPVTSMTQRLAKRGLVRRYADEADRRVGWFTLTPEGEAMVAAFAEHSQAKWATVLERLGPARAGNIVAVMEETIQILNTLYDA